MPLMIDNIVYLTTMYNRVVALDAETGRELWTFDPMAYRTRGQWDVTVLFDQRLPGRSRETGAPEAPTDDVQDFETPIRTERDRPASFQFAPRMDHDHPRIVRHRVDCQDLRLPTVLAHTEQSRLDHATGVYDQDVVRMQQGWKVAERAVVDRAGLSIDLE